MGGRFEAGMLGNPSEYSLVVCFFIGGGGVFAKTLFGRLWQVEP